MAFTETKTKIQILINVQNFYECHAVYQCKYFLFATKEENVGFYITKVASKEDIKNMKISLS